MNYQMKILYKFLNYSSLVFFVSLLFTVNSSHSKTFSISLQSKNNLSLDTWANYKGDIPSLKEFTVCHWNKVSYFSSAIDTIWNYCYTRTKDSTLWCLTMNYILLDSYANRHVLLEAWISNNVIRKEIIPFPHRKWNHICWTYSTITRNNVLYFNGKEIMHITTPRKEKMEFVEGYNVIYEGAFILGQEQDRVGGGYALNQVFSGEISDFEMWDHVLNDKMIEDFARCKKPQIGNVVKWEKELWQINQGSTIDYTKAKTFCQNETQHVIFPTRQPRKIAKTICEVHGGTIATPMSAEENELIKSLIEKHPDCVDEDKTSQRNWGTLAWLGLKRIDGIWYDISQDDSYKPVESSLWSGDPLFSKETKVIDCVYIKSDGTWMYIIQNNGTCDYLDICTVCNIPNTPVFTLKGICDHSEIDWNYYLGIDKSKGYITHYDGYKRGEILMSNNSWSSFGTAHNFTLPKNYKIPYPVGRFAWQIFEPKCGLNTDGYKTKHHLTLSLCEFPNEYTCDSGQCIDIENRCNGVDDCKDESDEKNCQFVEIPASYVKESPPKRHQESNKTFPLKTKLRITNINLIDTTEMVMELTFRLGMEWTDRRLKITNLPNKEPFTIPSNIIDQLWIPLDKTIHHNNTIGETHKSKIRFVRARSEQAHLPIRIEDPFENKPMDVEKVSLLIAGRYRVRYMCNFDLRKFPFDVQGCTISMFLYVQKNIEISFPNESQSVLYQGPQNVHQFDIEGISSEIRLYKDRVLLKYDVKMKRHWMNQVINVIFPTWLLFLLAYSTIFINLDNFNNRFMGSLTSLLVLTSLIGAINSGLPKTSYLKCIDYWFIWYITIIFLIIIHHVLLDNLSGGSKDNRNNLVSNTMEPNDKKSFLNRKAKQILFNKIAIYLFPFINVFFNVIFFFYSIDTHLENK